jgi:hypothetical protein
MATKWVAQIEPPVAKAPVDSQTRRVLCDAASARWISDITV